MAECEETSKIKSATTETTVAAEATTATTLSDNTRWGNAVTGELASDFLRIEGQGAPNNVTSNVANSIFAGFQGGGGILTITVVQARLAKNYGMTRMDPYCRLRIGGYVMETPTAYNGSKTPRWNKVIQCQIPEALREFHIEVFDECTFTVDERIAFGTIRLNDDLFKGEVVEKWYSLSGKQGNEKEGMIHFLFQYCKFGEQAAAGSPLVLSPNMVINPVMVNPNQIYGYTSYAPTVLPQQGNVPRLSQPQQQNGNDPQYQRPPEINQQHLKTLKEMCPQMDDDIIQSVLQQCGGDLDQAAGQLLEMSYTE